ncbi:response regulator [Porticoccus sp. W117]|uniref:HD domain-containing phosphohydrolase n=1 Tax=Porticoccus sp. W117 TaxID=3054777 RepID=UPI002592B134|nr:HD domain-containing phosphohydrolase [Porticoccus sp. W117]MDM3871723.1 response regulator [Porticoccus sp. W117]
MTEKVLFVDDESSILDGYRRTLRKRFTVVTALGGKEALSLMETEGPTPVVVSDMNMPEMNGVEFLCEVKNRYPDTVRLMLTGNADQQTAVSAINTSDVYRFLNKPCPPDQMAQVIDAALDHYKLLKMEQELLENTVKGSIDALVEILSLISPKIFGHASVISKYVSSCASKMGIVSSWDLEAAALLGQVGKVTLSDGVLDRLLKGAPLSEDEQQVYDRYPEVGAKLINNIPRMEGISQAIRYQNKSYDGTGLPDDGVSGDQIPLGARLLKPIMDLVAGETRGLSAEEALSRLKTNSSRYDPQVLTVLEQVISVATEKVVKEINVAQLMEGMIVATDIVTSSGTLLVGKGQAISSSMITRLINFCSNGAAPEKVNVLVSK